VRSGVDTDGDGRPDTLLTDDGVDLLVYSDLDGDGLADRLLRIGPDGTVFPDDPLSAGVDDAGPVPGRAAARSWVGDLWGGLFGPDTGIVGGPG
jgi:hypothetical protein